MAAGNAEWHAGDEDLGRVLAVTKPIVAPANLRAGALGLGFLAGVFLVLSGMLYSSPNVSRFAWLLFAIIGVIPGGAAVYCIIRYRRVLRRRISVHEGGVSITTDRGLLCWAWGDVPYYRAQYINTYINGAGPYEHHKWWIGVGGNGKDREFAFDYSWENGLEAGALLVRSLASRCARRAIGELSAGKVAEFGAVRIDPELGLVVQLSKARDAARFPLGDVLNVCVEQGVFQFVGAGGTVLAEVPQDAVCSPEACLVVIESICQLNRDAKGVSSAPMAAERFRTGHYVWLVVCLVAVVGMAVLAYAGRQELHDAAFGPYPFDPTADHYDRPGGPKHVFVQVTGHKAYYTGVTEHTTFRDAKTNRISSEKDTGKYCIAVVDGRVLVLAMPMDTPDTVATDATHSGRLTYLPDGAATSIKSNLPQELGSQVLNVMLDTRASFRSEVLTDAALWCFFAIFPLMGVGLLALRWRRVRRHQISELAVPAPEPEAQPISPGASDHSADGWVEN